MKISNLQLEQIIREEISLILSGLDAGQNQLAAIQAADRILHDYVPLDLRRIKDEVGKLDVDNATRSLLDAAIKDFGGDGPGTNILKQNEAILSGYSLSRGDQDKTLSDIESAEAEGALKVLPWYWKYAPASLVFRAQEEETPGLGDYL